MDPFSLTTADQIFAAFPEWQTFAREEQADDGSSFLFIEVTPPLEANVEHGLIVDTQNQEVTVGFDYYHSHFDQWVGNGEHFGTEAAFEFVKQILNEEVAVVSWWQEESGVARPSWRQALRRNHLRGKRVSTAFVSGPGRARSMRTSARLKSVYQTGPKGRKNQPRAEAEGRCPGK